MATICFIEGKWNEIGNRYYAKDKGLSQYEYWSKAINHSFEIQNKTEDEEDP